MIISHSRQFLFVHIHKAGGTSVEQALDPYLAWNDIILGGSSFGERINQSYKKRFGLHKHSSTAEIEALCGARYLEEYFVFSVVRHPLVRVCSIYNYVATRAINLAVRDGISVEEMRQRTAAKSVAQAGWAPMTIFLKTKNFSEFIRHGDLATTRGFQSQVAMLSRKAASAPAGQVFRLEDYPEWEARLSRQLRLDFRLPHANKSKVRVIAPEAVSAEDQSFVADLFGEDYEAFRYPRDPHATVAHRSRRREIRKQRALR